jgi:coenzyme PQQ biosynthesis enzyme PqqE
MSLATEERRSTEALCAMAPVGLLAELTHRCPLQCPYCSNPVALERTSGELTTAEWQRVLTEAAELGVLHLHLSGGEPTLRPDLEQIIETAAKVGLYSNLITAAAGLTRARLETFAKLGLDHVQISIQDAEPVNADRIGGAKRGHAQKMAVAGWVKELGLPLTINAPLHRQNLDNLPAIIRLAEQLGAGRIEVAHVQYYGWGLINRAALLPTREQVDKSIALVAIERQRLKGRMVIDFVAPDYHASRPKPCMGGWGRTSMNVTPSDTGTGVRDRARKIAAGHMAEVTVFQRLSGHRLDARTLPQLRIQGSRLGRMPLSGAAVGRQRRRGRSGLRKIASAWPGHGRGARRILRIDACPGAAQLSRIRNPKKLDSFGLDGLTLAGTMTAGGPSLAICAGSRPNRRY